MKTELCRICEQPFNVGTSSRLDCDDCREKAKELKRSLRGHGPKPKRPQTIGRMTNFDKMSICYYCQRGFLRNKETPKIITKTFCSADCMDKYVNSATRPYQIDVFEKPNRRP